MRGAFESSAVTARLMLLLLVEIATRRSPNNHLPPVA